MSCPHYRDYTRDCIDKFDFVIRYENFKKCESEDYQKCIIYHILRSDFQCKYLDSCFKMLPKEIPEMLILMSGDTSVYEFMTKPVHGYCLSKEKYTQCARYKIKEQGKEPSNGLNPDGKNINIAESVQKQKIVIDESN
jgi:hypothetical protein